MLLLENVTYFKKLIMHLYRQCTDIYIQTIKHNNKTHCVLSGYTPYESAYFQIQLNNVFFLDINDDDDSTDNVFCIDSYTLQMIIKRLTHIVSEIKFYMSSTHLKIGIFTNTKKTVKCTLPLSFKQNLKPYTIRSSSHAHDQLQIPIQAFCNILQQLNNGFHHVYITLQHNSLHFCSMSDWAEANIYLTGLKEGYIEIGKFSIVMLLHICEFALSMTPKDYILLQLPDNINDTSIKFKFCLKYSSAVTVICAQSV